ncbi:SPOR domain-containing protein [Steroidobacter sp. S1-65]|uniref:SPOR domain-containing protein n=1 Tax=Steroidobacter gossypii TaxID=2805490 RepID=A0ABS1X465_9GAMM|nr:SPOR domain-containing protein [Steroidobacter gossypii]MBM0108018.1 SPOR domain-containing protein [Steroidobacter gossypii]
MRAFCLLLVLINALYFIWSQVIDVQVSSLDRVPIRMAAPPPRIVLAKEAQSGVTAEPEPEEEDEVVADVREVVPPQVAPLESPGAAQPAAPSTAARQDALTCTSVGPFADLGQASQAQATLRTLGFQPRQRVEQGELWTGYWVSVRDFPTREAAEAALVKLNNNGITDVYLMPGTDPPNVLSLGVFSDYQRAQRRAEEVRSIGLSPQISDRKRAGSVFWLDVDLKEPGETIDTSLFQVGQSRILRLELRGCPQTG